MKKLVTVLSVALLSACGSRSSTADGGYATDSTAGNVNSVSGTRDSAGAGSMYKDSVTGSRDSVNRQR
jgi:hypothetical protein